LGGGTIALVGDLAADCYQIGETHRVSREAPVLIIRQTEEFVVPGQAGNAAANLAAHGATTLLAGYLGSDSAGADLRACLEERGIDASRLVAIPGARTATKTRILAGGRHTRRQQVVRIDREDCREPDAASRQRLREGALSAVAAADACLFSDYGYQAVDDALWCDLRDACRSKRIPLLLDSRHRGARFRGADLATPNEEEALELAGWRRESGVGSGEELARAALEATGAAAILLKRGNEGMVAMARDGSATPFATGLDPARGGFATFGVHGAEEPVDVSGAGDTVAATIALALAAGATLLEAAHLSNVAAGVSVGKVGAASVSPEELLRALERWPEELRPARPAGEGKRG